MKASYDSVGGRIESTYKIKDGEITLSVTIPPNTSATVILPADLLDGVTESGGPLAEAEGVSVVDTAARTVLLHSGRYEFAIPHGSKP